MALYGDVIGTKGTTQMANAMPQSYWESLIAGAVRVKQPADVAGIARLCIEAQERGETPGAWHAAAQFYGYPERCNCVPCKSARDADKWAEGAAAGSWSFHGRSRRYSIVQLRANRFSVRRADAFVNSLVGYSETLDSAKARAEKDDAS
jgi:hypothetical protein